MKMAFFELEGWEKPVLANLLAGHELFLHEDVLSPMLYPQLSGCESAGSSTPP